MTDKKIAAPVGQLGTASKSFNANKFNWFDYRIKVVIHHLAPWFFLVGGLHG
jgi:hypothetical protein